MCPVDYAAVIAHLVPIFLKESGFWTLSIVHSFLKSTAFWKLDMVSVFRLNDGGPYSVGPLKKS
jgi:hypothetical protein